MCPLYKSQVVISLTKASHDLGMGQNAFSTLQKELCDGSFCLGHVDILLWMNLTEWSLTGAKYISAGGIGQIGPPRDGGNGVSDEQIWILELKGSKVWRNCLERPRSARVSAPWEALIHLDVAIAGRKSPQTQDQMLAALPFQHGSVANARSAVTRLFSERAREDSSVAEFQWY